MKPLSERMNRVATERRIRTPAIWTILGDYAEEVEGLEAELTSMEDAVSVFKRVRELEADKEYLAEQLHRVARERDECYRQHRLAAMRRKEKDNG